ncbi:MAG: hypothetical protein V8T38_03080 [Oscillospiraceae bacterium]
MNFKDVIKRVFLYFKRDPKECVALICAACIMAISFLTASYPAFAADTVKTWNDWDEVGDDAIALRDAYVKYLREVGEGDFIGALGKGVDVPIKWLKLLSDGRLVLSPCDDIIYFLKDNVLQSTHKQGKEADTGLASRLKPVIDGKTGKQLYNYWSEYYKPHPNSSQYIYSYQSNESDVGKNNLYFFNPTPPVYVNNDWGKKQYWTGGVYVLPFYQDDDLSEGTLYPDRYAYFHTSGTSKEGNLNICLDIYNLSDNKLISSFSAPWDIVKCPYVSWELLNLRFYRVILYPTYLDYMSGSNKKYLRPDITTDYGYFYGGKYVKYKLIDSLLQSTTFTPDTNKNDDWGYIMSNEPFQLFANQAQIDYDKIPDNYTITINGDTIYDYDITNPDTGDHGTVNYYITNNYTLPENGSKDDTKDDSGSGTVSGNVTVGGKVDVSGKIEIDTKPIDININVNGGGSGSSGSGDVSSSPEGVEFDQDVSLNNYYGWMQEQTTGFSGFMKNFFSWLPDPIVIMLCAGFALVILARFLGR